MTNDKVSLREYFDMRLGHIESNITTAKAEMDRRLDGMNEFREQLRVQEQTYMPRKEVESSMAAVNSDIRMLRESRAVLEGKASQNSMYVSLLFAAAGLSLSIISLVMHFLK